jgi:apolipoprotein N-acyltransferase
MLVGDLPTGRGGTVYSRSGDVFAQAVVVVWLVLLALRIRRHGHVSPG